MARRSAFGVKVDASELDGFVQRLGAVSPEELGAHLVDAINETIDETYDIARARMLAGINLTDDYIQRKMHVEHATASKTEATITAFGNMTTSLSHYGAMQETHAVNWSNDRIQSMGKQFGKWPGWTRRTGSAELGIAENRKAAGKTVEVTKGSRKRLGSQFSIPGKVDGDGNLLIFRRRKGSDKLEALMGPSVYQLFRVAAGAIEGDVAENLVASVVALAEKQMKKAIG